MPHRGVARPPSSAPCAGMSPWSPRVRLTQPPLSGHSTQAGFFGVQIEAPKSISACALSPAREFASPARDSTSPARGFTSPAREGPSSVAASRWISGLACGNTSSTANNRDTTRSILPSTGMVCRPNAIAAIAAAVYGADPRQLAQAFFSVRKNAAMVTQHREPRRHAGCARGNSSRARPTSAAHRPATRCPSAATSGHRATNFSK